MAALTADITLNIDAHGGGMPLAFPMVANDIIYKGALVGIIAADGYAVPMTGASTEEFIGVAVEQVDNTISGNSEGSLKVRVLRRCEIEMTTIAGGSTDPLDIGTEVYVVSNDNPLDGVNVTTTALNNVSIGKITYYDTDRSVYRVLLEADSVRSV